MASGGAFRVATRATEEGEGLWDREAGFSYNSAASYRLRWWKKPSLHCKPSNPDFRGHRPDGVCTPNSREGKKQIPASEDEKST